MFRRLPRSVLFVLVGCVAAAVHWLTVIGLVAHAMWQPVAANVIGWLVALGVSFSGHHHLSFQGHGAPVWRSALRFIMLSAGGFAVNELTFAALLHWSGLRYDVLLGGVLVGVAAVTWWISRTWVFRNAAGRP